MKHPRAAAIAVAKEIVTLINPVCDRLVVAGSLRRRKAMVGDVEILYIPRIETRKVDLLHTAEIDLVAEVLRQACASNILQPRIGKTGNTIWGDSNKLAVHVASGIPIDFFKTDSERWANMLVCRTGSAENNIRIATAAQAKGLQWLPYGAGFFDKANKRVIKVASEQGEAHRPPLALLLVPLLGFDFGSRCS